MSQLTVLNLTNLNCWEAETVSLKILRYCIVQEISISYRENFKDADPYKLLVVEKA